MAQGRKVFSKWIPLMAFILALSLQIQAQMLESIKSQVKVHTLDNGMKFIVLERHEAPVVSFHVYADVGAANESYGITGISHILEHMAFKGTKIIGTTNFVEEAKILDKMDALYEEIRREETKPVPSTQKLEEMKKAFEDMRLEAKKYVVTDEFVDMLQREGDRNVNAYTNTDATQYIDSLPSNKLEFWMAITSDRFLNPVFREFFKERDVVMEERRLSTETRPLGRLLEDFMAVAFKAHPYHHGVIGHMSDLQTITRKDVADYFSKFYGPSNLTVGIVGDVQADEVFQMAEAYFGRIPGGPRPEAVRTREPEQWGERRVAVEMKSQPFLLMGYHSPEARHPDSPALEALANILGQGRSSRIYQSLVKEAKAAVDTSVFPGFPGDKYPSLTIFFAVPAQGRTSQECVDLIDKEIEKITKESVTLEELTKFQRTSMKRMMARMSSNADMAELLTNADVVLGDWRETFDRIKKIQAVTAEDIRRVAVRYFTRKNRVIGEVSPAAD